MSLRWRGDELKKRLLDASRWGVDKTMSECVIHAKQNHPGWKNRTGTAEGSIRIQDPASVLRKGVVGRWGSVQVKYMIWLELKYGSALRSTADVKYKGLRGHIRSRFRR